MSPSRPATIDAALKRLSGALDQLEAAVAQGRQSRDGRGDVEQALASAEHDRQRLAHELEAALGRTSTLEQATDEVARRLSQAGGALRRLLEPGQQDR